MIHTEVIECLKELDDQTLAKVMRMIFDWYDEKPVEPQTQIEKFAWKLILPRLESNKESYLALIERNKENGKKGGAPIGNKNASRNKTTEGLNETTENNQKQHNINSNNNNNSTNNSSSEELLDYSKQPSSPESDEVVSKGLESLEKLFPQGRNQIGIDEVNLWNNLTQDQKQVMIKRGSMYIRNEKKKEDGKYIKGIGKWMREQMEKGFETKSPSMKNSTSKDDPRLLQRTDGSVYSAILQKVQNSTQKADKIYNEVNKKDLFNDRDQLLTFIKSLDQQEINDILQN